MSIKDILDVSIVEHRGREYPPDWLTAMVCRSWPKSESSFPLGPLLLRQVNFRISDARLEYVRPDRRHLYLAIDAPHVSDGDPLRLTFDREICWYDDAARDAQTIRCAVHEMVLHEVDEWFSANGERVFDPHAARSES